MMMILIFGRRTTATTAAALLTLGSVRALSSSAGAAAAAASSSMMNTKISGARCLGGTDLVVSEACLGTMTFGVQNNKQDAFEQLNYSISSCGVNFIDTAELYPVPLTAPDWRAGATEEIVGEYLARIGASRRDELVVATKVCGYFPNSPVAAARYVPPLSSSSSLPDCRLDAQSVKTACEASLRRLQTDRIDLYQIHWPDRYLPVFGQTVFDHDQKRNDDIAIEETATALRDLIQEGKVRYIGVSNESSLGVCQWVQACKKLGIADKLASIQNSYSLLDRRFESELAEVCDAYQIGLLPWSVLAGGLLTGKYQKGKTPSANARFVKYPEYMKRWSPKTASGATLSAVDEYAKIAQEAGMTPAELAIAFCRSRRFVLDAGSTIVGATTLEQLKQNLAPFRDPVHLPDDVLEAINKVHLQCPSPSCSI